MKYVVLSFLLTVMFISGGLLLGMKDKEIHPTLTNSIVFSDANGSQPAGDVTLSVDFDTMEACTATVKKIRPLISDRPIECSQPLEHKQ